MKINQRQISVLYEMEIDGFEKEDIVKLLQLCTKLQWISWNSMFCDLCHERWKYERHWYSPSLLEAVFFWPIHTSGHILGKYILPCSLKKVKFYTKLYFLFVYREVSIHRNKYSSTWEVSSNTKVLHLTKVSSI